MARQAGMRRREGVPARIAGLGGTRSPRMPRLQCGQITCQLAELPADPTEFFLEFGGSLPRLTAAHAGPLTMA
ncbi:hypothetical protein BKA15_005764 [Microlunatus parietis]|uniref:Uncharacterized protein n=1 Tax=Microlunatus parietis TaxID=682979 RepID=A0A7Y9ICS7_9ACTN|nr:hypothetical protein [Microlunatus parietis]